jgi:tellurite resistance protein TerC
VNVPLWGWAAVLGAVLAMLAVDLLAHRRAHAVSVREAAVWSAVWVTAALAFGGVLWSGYGGDIAGQYAAGYLIEKSLAVDNVFVFALIFSALGIPRQYQHRVLFLGVIGALVLRGAFIAGGAVLVERFHWVLYLFGAFLVLTGVRMLRHRDGHGQQGLATAIRLLRRVMPVSDDFDGARLLTRRAGVLVATPLLAALILVETADVVFAVDSIPAVFAVTREPFLVFTSNVFAILGLRAMFFLLAALLHRFVHLKVGLAVILVGVGIKLVLVDLWPVPTGVSLGFIVATLTISILASLRSTRPHHPLPAGDSSVPGAPAGTPPTATAPTATAPTPPTAPTAPTGRPR